MFSLFNIRLQGAELPWFWMSLFVNKSVYTLCILCLKINCCRRDSKFSAISFSKRIFSVPQQWKWTHFQLRGTGGAALHTIVLCPMGRVKAAIKTRPTLTYYNIHTHSWIAVLASMVSFGWIFSNNPYTAYINNLSFFTKIYQDRNESIEN